MHSVIVTFLFMLTSLSSLATESEFSVIAHRGASGYLPEHTLPAAALAHAQGADYIEQDVVLTKDGFPIVVHDIHLENISNVALLFPHRARKDGRFYAIDFTLAEIRLLTVHERKDNNQQVFKKRYQGNAQFRISTLAEHVELISELNRLSDKDIGLYIEIKSPAFHKQHGLDISKVIIDYLRSIDMDSDSAKVFVQCFDFKELKRIRTELKAKVPLIQLIAENSWQESDTDYDLLKTSEGMVTVAKYADGIGPWLGHVAIDKSNKLSSWLAQAKALGLLIHPYTFRTDALPEETSQEQLLDLVINQWQFDGLFTDQVPPVTAFINRKNNLVINTH